MLYIILGLILVVCIVVATLFLTNRTPEIKGTWAFKNDGAISVMSIEKNGNVIFMSIDSNGVIRKDDTQVFNKNNDTLYQIKVQGVNTDYILDKTPNGDYLTNMSSRRRPSWKRIFQDPMSFEALKANPVQLDKFLK